MTIAATRPRGTSLRGDHYICSRCGREARFNLKRGRPELCRDCHEITTTPTAREPSA